MVGLVGRGGGGPRPAAGEAARWRPHRRRRSLDGRRPHGVARHPAPRPGGARVHQRPGGGPGALRGAVEEGLAGGIDIFPGIGSDIADPDAHETSYEGTPLRPLVTLFDGVESFQSGLSSIACPVLILNSPQDHVVAPSNSDHLAASVGGPVERVTLERSFHVATLDYDKDLVTERFLEFTAKATAS